MKKILLQFDTDALPSSFDAVAAYDSGVDQILSYSGITPGNVRDLVHGAIFTRGGDQLRNTAIWIGGGNVAAGEQVLEAVQSHFFGGFRVSVMLDSNGCNTTAAATVVKIARAVDVRGAKVVVLGGAGPVGTRVAGLFALEGARVVVTSRSQDRLTAVADQVQARFGQPIETAVARTEEEYRAVLEGATVAVGAGAAGVRLISLDVWRDHPTLKAVADLNLAPPAGIEGVEIPDNGTERYGKLCFGPVGIGNLKMKVHRACVARLFEQKDLVFEAEAVYKVAREI